MAKKRRSLLNSFTVGVAVGVFSAIAGMKIADSLKDNESEVQPPPLPTEVATIESRAPGR